jgi:hypothetical protein
MEKVITMTSFINNLTEMHGIADLFPSCPRAFKQFQIPEILCIPPEKPDIEQITNIYVSIEIKNTTVRKYYKNKSLKNINTALKLNIIYEEESQKVFNEYLKKLQEYAFEKKSENEMDR